MNQFGQGESSSGLSVLPLKRRRGRPRKDPSLKKKQSVASPPGFEAGKQSLPQRVNKADGVDTMVGQPVTGVVEATFDAGYLLRVKIGNSSMNFRGVVFKPGHFVPVTPENDVAPHLQMIRRNDVNVPAGNTGWSRTQKLAVQAGALVPSKRKHGAPQQMVPSVPPVGVRGTLVPVLLQPKNLSNGSQNNNQAPPETPRTAHMMAFGDKDVHMVEPLNMLPPDRSIPVGQIFLGSKTHPINQVAQATNKYESNIQGEKANQMQSMEIDNPGSSDTSETQTDSGKEASKSSAEDSGAVSKQETGSSNQPFSTESMQTPSMTKPFFNYGTGRMTELLQAVQENMKDNKVQIAEERPSGSKDEARAARTTETVPKNEAFDP